MTKEEAEGIIIAELTIKRDWTLNGLDHELIDDFANILRERVENFSIAPVSLGERSETTVCHTYWCAARDKKLNRCTVNDFDCEERQTGN